MARRVAARADPDADTRILVLHGPEHALQREIMRQLQATMAAAHPHVDLLSFDGEQCALADVFDELRSFGLMQQYKIVQVDAADRFVSDHRSALERYAQQPADHATLVLRCTRWYKGKLDKHISKVGHLIKCDGLSPSQLRERLLQQATAAGRRIDPAVADQLIGRIGPDLGRLGNELEKLIVAAEPGGTIDPDLIDQIVGRASDEQAWSVQEALLEALAGGPRGQLVEKLHELVEVSGQPEVLVSYFVADMIRKLEHGLAMRRQGANDFQISSALKMWRDRQRPFLAALARLDEPAAASLFDRVVRCNLRGKRGLGTTMRNIECFCAVLDDPLPIS